MPVITHVISPGLHYGVLTDENDGDKLEATVIALFGTRQDAMRYAKDCAQRDTYGEGFTVVETDASGDVIATITRYIRDETGGVS